MKSYVKVLSCITAGAAALAILGGCGKNSVSENGGKLKCWMPLTSNMALYTSNYGETALAKELQKRTGVEVEFVHPPQGQESEKFSILITSTNLPDIVEYNWINYPGGPAKAIKEGVIIDIAKHRDKAVNLFKYLDENKEVYKMASTDSNEVFSFPFIRGDESLGFSTGLVVRGDWLEELGLELPQTVEDWEAVLRAFKNKKGAQAPYSSSDTSRFASAFDTTESYYVEDGKVKYGPLDPQFKDYIQTMKKWYQEGLIDQSFTTVDGKGKEANILNGYSGATAASIGSGIGKWMASATTEGYSLEGAPVPVPQKGRKAKFGVYQQLVTPSGRSFDAITTSCKNVDAAIKFLDYGYSEEGRMLYNFGIEGESYEMKDGYPTYTEQVTNNPEGRSMTVALSNYARSYDAGPFVQDKRYMEQYANLPQQQRAWKTWSNTDAPEYTLPNLYVKDEEMNEYAQKKTDIDTYAGEMIMRFIIGAEPMENYDNMIAELHNRGIDRVIEICQSAYERYLNK